MFWVWINFIMFVGEFVMGLIGHDSYFLILALMNLIVAMWIYDKRGGEE